MTWQTCSHAVVTCMPGNRPRHRSDDPIFDVSSSYTLRDRVNGTGISRFAVMAAHVCSGQSSYAVASARNYYAVAK